MNLSEKISSISQSMTSAERACFKILLSTAAAEILRDGHVPSEGVQAAALSTSIKSIVQLQPHRDRVPSNGVIYRGRPGFLTDDILNSLINESQGLRETAVRFHDHLVVSGAPLARKFAYSNELRNLLSPLAGQIEPTSKANYLYYDKPGLGIEPHVDNEEFSLNVILMLKHKFISSPSALVLFPLDATPEKVYLSAGEIIVLFADSIVHKRERVSINEKISIAAFGFSPAT